MGLIVVLLAAAAVMVGFVRRMKPPGHAGR
jgi:hypothetical protein